MQSLHFSDIFSMALEPRVMLFISFSLRHKFLLLHSKIFKTLPLFSSSFNLMAVLVSTSTGFATVAHEYENSNNPLFLHHSNNSMSGAINPLLTKSNYHTWSRAFLMSLSIMNKVGILIVLLLCQKTMNIVKRFRKM